MTKKHLLSTFFATALGLVASHRCVAAPPLVINSSANSVSVNYYFNGQTFTDSDASVMPNFSRTVSADASDDASKSQGSLYVSVYQGADYRFQGSGRVGFEAGSFLGNPSQLSTAQATGFLSITANASFHYEYYVACAVNGANSSVQFRNSDVSSTGQYFESGTIAAGSTFTLVAHCANAPGALGGMASFNYALQMTPLSVPSRFTAAQKYAMYQNHILLFQAGEQALAMAKSTPTDEMAESLLEQWRSDVTTAENYYQEYLDPLDTNYTVLVQATFPTFTPLAASNSVTAAAAEVFNAWLTNLFQAVEYGTAWSTSVNRAQGAANAGDSFWDNAQMSAAAEFEVQLAAVIDQEPALRSNVLAQFVADKIPALTLTSNQAASLQLEFATNGFPSDAIAGLTSLGITGLDLTNIEAEMITADPGALAGTFPQCLGDTNFDAAQFSLAGSLRDASLVLINPALLSGGRFRADLPTEPGYTYTIQFSQNPADPTSWTAIITNTATAFQLSFTNTVPAGAQAGFYRATHN
jgi:hypothetical protein